MNESLSRQEIVEVGKKRRLEKLKKAVELKDKGYSNVAIGREMDLSESSVRVLLIVHGLVQTLRDEVARKGVVDVGKGAEKNLGVTRPKLIDALDILSNEGYEIMNARFKQNDADGYVTVKVLALPGTTWLDVIAKGRPEGVGL